MSWCRLLATTGLYGVIAYSASQRTREVGIRVALGAAQGDVVKMVVRQGMILVIVGTVIGLGLAAAATRPLGSLLYGIGSVQFSLCDTIREIPHLFIEGDVQLFV